MQIFWRRVKPIPCFDQSVVRQVTFPRSNAHTQFSTAVMISSLDFSKSVLGFSRLLKGSMMSDWEKAKLHWFMGPNNDLIPVMSLGLGKSLMTPRNFSEGLTESPVST